MKAPPRTIELDQTPVDITPYQLDPDVKVSVLVIAYNHERFIRQSIESVLAQETPFRYEVVVAEDCSTDGTRTALSQLAAEWPGRVSLILRDRNVGMQQNVVDGLRHCRGRYVALLDGDDYWTSPHKLRKQVELMEADPTCVMSSHNVALSREDGSDGSVQMFPTGGHKLRMQLPDLFENYVPAISVMLRTGVIRQLPSWIMQERGMDKPLQLLAGQHGSVVYLDEIMATYRMNRFSAYNPLDQVTKSRRTLEFLERFDAHFGFRYHAQVNRAALRYWMMIASHGVEAALESGEVESQLAVLRCEMLNLLKAGPLPLRLRRTITGAFLFNVALGMRASPQRQTARRLMLRAIICDARLMLNRGTWSVLVRGLIARPHGRQPKDL